MAVALWELRKGAPDPALPKGKSRGELPEGRVEAWSIGKVPLEH